MKNLIEDFNYMKIGIFTGTFDPFTIGHQNIAERALPMFDKLVIAVAMSKLKHANEEIEKRVEDIKAVFPKECAELVDAGDASKGFRLEVVSYDDLTIDLAHRLGAKFLVRGVRSAKDFEYERDRPTSTGSWVVWRPFSFSPIPATAASVLRSSGS